MHDVFFLAIAVRNVYKGRQDFEVVCRFLSTLYASHRLQLPLRGILVVGIESTPNQAMLNPG
jgi:hypothetical protein